MKTTQIIITTCALAFFSVGAQRGSADPGPLAKYQKEIKAIFTEERLRQVVDPGSENVKVAVEESGNSLSVSWTWPSDRMQVTDLGFTKIETVSGIADACRWVPNDSTLVVGQGDVFLAIYSNISADAAANRDAALKLAKLITSK